MKDKKYIEARDLPEDERVYLKRTGTGWAIVHPIKNEDGSTNYTNLIFGGRANFIKLLIYVGIALLIGYGVQEVVMQYRDIADNPCLYCEDCSMPVNPLNFTINFSEFQGGEIE